MIKILIFVLLFLLELTSLRAEEVPDSLAVQRKVALGEVVVTGTRNETDVRHLPMTVSVVNRGVDFEMPAEEQVIAANDSVAYLNVIVKRNKALKGSAIAVFEVQVSDDFMPGIEANRKGRIFITNQLTRPGWWNDWHEANGLGTYSDLKYQTFIREIGVTDMTLEADGGEMNYSTMRAYVLQFKYWLQDHPIEDEDGSLMKVAMRG